MSIRTGQTSQQAPQSVEANGSEADALALRVELRLQDRADRARRTACRRRGRPSAR